MKNTENWQIARVFKKFIYDEVYSRVRILRYVLDGNDVAGKDSKKYDIIRSYFAFDSHTTEKN